MANDIIGIIELGAKYSFSETEPQGGEEVGGGHRGCCLNVVIKGLFVNLAAGYLCDEYHCLQ